MIDICLLGTGGMMPLHYRWLTALFVRYNGRNTLIDCGEGTQIALRKKGWSPKPVDVILFTHYHADHISGLPGMLLSMANADRTEPVHLYGPKGLARVVGSLRVITPDLPFELVCHELNEAVETFPYPGEEEMTVTAFRVSHSVTTYGYSLSLSRKGRFDPVAAAALGLPKPMWGRLQHGETVEYEGKTYTPDLVMGDSRKGLKITYVTDTRPCPSIVENAAGSDLFICEGMYGEPDSEDKAREHRHMTFDEAAKLAANAGVKEMWLTHYSPSMTHPDQYMDRVKKIFPEAKAGKDGKSIVMRFDDEDEE